MPDTDALAERARVIAWLRSDEAKALFRHQLPDALERGDHDYIAIPRLHLGDQGAK